VQKIYGQLPDKSANVVDVEEVVGSGSEREAAVLPAGKPGSDRRAELS
jgi:aconitase B